MYIIEMHYRNRAFAQVIMEKGDFAKTYEDLSRDALRTIVNHSGDVDARFCSWCESVKRVREPDA
jgi:hypothetical protein